MKKKCILFTILAITVSPAFAANPSYVRSPAESRAYILEYCRLECEENLAKPRRPYRSTFEKALNGDFRALHTVFFDETYHTNDAHWDLIPWYILQVIGDSRYADFVRSRPLAEGSTLLALQWPYVGSAEQATFEAFFRKHFPRTYALWTGFGMVDQYPEPNRLDYGPRRLSEAVAAEPRFRSVRLSKRFNKKGQTLVTAPSSLSRRDRADLKALIAKYLGNNVELEFR
jgi:hypothetical protein